MAELKAEMGGYYFGGLGDKSRFLLIAFIAFIAVDIC